MKKIIFLFLTFIVALSFTYAQQYTKGPVSDDDWKPIILNPDGTTAIFLDDMNGDNSVTGLEARGWVVLNEDGGGITDPWFQRGTVFNAYEGPADGHVASNFNGANGLLIDQWLISEEITVSTGDTLSFWYRAPDGSIWPDSLYIRYSTTAGITPGDFDQTWGRYEVPLSWSRWTGTFSHSGTIRFAIQYYITDAVTNSNYIGIDYIEVISAGGGGTITIAEAREDLDMDFIPDHLGEILTIEGTISSPNYNTDNFNYVINDGTAGITSIFFGYTGPEYNMGDVVQVTGEITQFAGLTQISPADDADVVFMGTGGALPDFTVLTLAEYFANPESYEGELLAFGTLTAAGGGDPWPTSGNNANFNLTDALGIDTLIMRIDKETDLDENPEPTWPKDIIGFGSQFTFDTPPNNGYQNLPRMYSEILPPGTIPVELTSFTAQVSSRVVTLNWTTATELNNQGFEVQRGTDGTYRPIGFVNGFGTTTDIHNYSFTDTDVQIGTYYYRLKQVDFNGEYAYSDVVQVDVVAPANFSLEQNYPNPFNPSTKITFNLAVDSKVSLKVFDVLGQEVTKLIGTNMTAGVHEVNFSAIGGSASGGNALNLNSGVYFYRIDATGVDGTNFTSVKKMILTK